MIDNKDSKEKKEVGEKFDSGKPRWTLLPIDSVEEVIKVLEYGAKKYSVDNWKNVDNFEQRYLNAMMRHLTSYMKGEKNDPETNISHIAHAICSGLFLLWKEKN